MGLDSMLTIHGGKGKFVSGLGAAPGMKVLILGGGVVGQAALAVLHALGAWVTVADINIGTLRSLQNQYRQNINTMISNRENIRQILPETDMVLNLSLIHISTYSKESFISDVSILFISHRKTMEKARQRGDVNVIKRRL